MSRILMALVIVIMMSSANAAVYHFFNGEKLAEAALEWEKSQASPKDADLLLVAGYAGYVGAMFDHLSVGQHICTPDEMTKNEVLKVVADHVKTKNRGLKYSASTIIEEALVESYTCKRWIDPK